MAKCQAFTKAGKPCKGNALPDSDFCMAHQPQEEAAPETVAPTPAVIPYNEADNICGHENKHFIDDLPLVCDLPPGHAGNHSAEYETTDYKQGGPTFQGKKRTYWSDLAGTPVDQIKQVPIPKTTADIAREAALAALLEHEQSQGAKS